MSVYYALFVFVCTKLSFFDNFPVKWVFFYQKIYNFAQKYIGDVLTTYNVYVTHNAFSTQNYNNLDKH